jgi:putative ABC transport system permease protein
LVLLMVGLPVLLIVTGATLLRTADVSPEESLPGRLGAADALVQGVARESVYADPTTGEPLMLPGEPGEPWSAAEVGALLPQGARVVERSTGSIGYRTGSGSATVDAYVDDLTDPVRDGAFAVVEGRVPEAAGEVAVSEAVAERGPGVGDEVGLTRDDVPATVVGVLRTESSEASYLLLPPAWAGLLEDARTEFLATVPGGLDWPAVQDLNARGLVVVSREVVADPPPAEAFAPPGSSGGDAAQTAVLALVAAALVLEVVLMAGPAFAVGLRRRRRDLALIAASGGTPADLRRSVLASGLLLGGGAALAGAVLGPVLAWAAVPVLEDRLDTTFGPFDLPVREALLAVGVGTLAGLAAAYVPARQAARTDVAVTLAGRRGQVRSSRRLPLLGLLLAAGGLVLTVLGARGTELAVAGGAVLLVVGVLLATSWLIGLLAPLARWLPVSGRLAVRDATRHRSRTAPAVAAILATVAGVTALAIGIASDSAQSQRDYVPRGPMGAALISPVDGTDWDAVRAALGRELPGRDVVALDGVSWSDPAAPLLRVTRSGCTGTVDDCGWYDDTGVPVSFTLTDVLVAEPGALAGLLPEELAPGVADALERGRVAVVGTGAVDAQGAVRLEAVRYDEATGRGQSLGSADLPGAEVPLTGDAMVVLPAQVFVPASLAGQLPAPVETLQLVVGGPGQPVTPAEQARLADALQAVGAVSLYVERGWSDDSSIARLLLVLVGGTLVLVATLTATGLAVADARPDHATLAAIGAPPRTRRLVAMGSAAVIGGTGALLGVLAGLAPGIAVAYPLTSTNYGAGADPLVVVPWDLLAAVAVGVPLVAVVVTGLAVRSRLPMTTRLAD